MIDSLTIFLLLRNELHIIRAMQIHTQHISEEIMNKTKVSDFCEYFALARMPNNNDRVSWKRI